MCRSKTPQSAALGVSHSDIGLTIASRRQQTQPTMALELRSYEFGASSVKESFPALYQISSCTVGSSGASSRSRYRKKAPISEMLEAASLRVSSSSADPRSNVSDRIADLCISAGAVVCISWIKVGMKRRVQILLYIF